MKNKHLLSISLKHIQHDLQYVEQYLNALKNLLPAHDYDRHRFQYLQLKFEMILLDSKDFSASIDPLVDELQLFIDRFHPEQADERKIELFIRSGSYLLNLDKKKRLALNFYDHAAQLAENQHEKHPSEKHRFQLAQALLQQSQAKVRTDRANARSTTKDLEEIENDFQRAIKLFERTAEPLNRNVLRVIDELATYYTKIERFQDALNVLCETLPEKIRIFGDFSDEVIQTESRIGAIYLREGECLNAVEHLKTVNRSFQRILLFFFSFFSVSIFKNSSTE